VHPASLLLGLILVSPNSIESPVGLDAKTSPEDLPLLAVSLAHTGLRRLSEFAAEVRIEYRADRLLWLLKPFGGVAANSSGGLHAFAGVLIDFYLGQRLVFTPSFAPGLYHAGKGKDLGFPVEFRSQLELSYQFPRGSRIGIGVSHLSNARLGRINPGIEAVSIVFSTPGILAGAP
jgi:lipid A 3-O-deacylase